MSGAADLKEEMQHLERRLAQLKQKLLLLQKDCRHEFVRDAYSQTCRKCHTSQSLRW